MTGVSEQDLRDHAEEMERTKADPYPSGGAAPARPGRARSRVLQVRLNPEEYEAVVAYARERGVPTSAMARAAILAQLRAEAVTLPGAVERLAGDVEQLRQLVDRRAS